MDFIELVHFVVAILLSLTVHEASHALAAYYLGDPTAKMNGRISLNPIRHLDPYGTMVFVFTMLIGTPFGWGKPVIVDPRNFKHPVRDSGLTALAGPVSNFVMAFMVALPLKYLVNYMPPALEQFLLVFFSVNVVLGLFNLFPFPPLDGSKILGLMVPRRFHRQYLNYIYHGQKYFIVIILIDVFILRDFLGYSIMGYIIGGIYHYVSLALLLGT